MNYRDLLKTYMRHVAGCEGYAFLAGIDTELNEDDAASLLTVARELRAEGVDFIDQLPETEPKLIEYSGRPFTDVEGVIYSGPVPCDFETHGEGLTLNGVPIAEGTVTLQDGDIIAGPPGLTIR